MRTWLLPAVSVVLLGGCIAADAPAVDARATVGAIVFPSNRTGDREIYIMERDGSGVRRLTFHTSEELTPVLSPDGGRILFSTDRDGNMEIYVMNADGSDPVNLTRHPARDHGAVFSPDGRRIVFHSDRDGNQELYLMNADGSQPTRLTQHPGVDAWANWSPDGRTIAFQRDGDIHLLDLETWAITRLMSDPELDDMPTFSPDGERITFMSMRDGYSAIYVMARDGSGQTNITPKPGDVPAEQWTNMFPRWAADGRIYFFGLRPETGPQPDIFVMAADGSGVTRLTTDPAMDGAPWPAPAVAPDRARGASARASAGAVAGLAAGPGDEELIASAVSAAPEAVSGNATIITMGPGGAPRVLREGSNGYTCMPDNPHTPGNMPVCADAAGMAWMMSLAMQQDPPAGAPPSVAYMMQGSAFPSIDDPEAGEAHGGAAWILTGPMLMLMNVPVMPQGQQMSDVDVEAPFVMYAGTPYEHLMIPVRPPQRPDTAHDARGRKAN
jgi:Tol biopolymer transport system component